MADEYDPLAPRQDAFMRTLGEAVNEFRAMDVRAVFTTVCLLTILFSGYYIPLYGLDLEMVSQMKLSSGAIDRVSMLTLSVAPWVSVVILVETIGLFIAPLRASIGFRDGHCNPFHWFVILLTMVLTAVQAYGINTAYQATGLVSVVSLLSSIVIIGSIVAGTIVTVLIAAFINAWGVGYGFWLVFGFTLPFAIPDSLHTRFELAREGQIPFFPGWAIEVGILLAVMLVTVLLTRSLINKEITTPARLVFPLMIGGQLAAYALAFTYYITNYQLSIFEANLVFIALMSAFTMLLLWIYLRDLFDWKLLLLAVTCLSAFSISPTLLAMVGFDNGWYWTATAVETVAFIACLTFIASGVYGRRNTVGKP